MINKKEMIERFINYTSVYTTSDPMSQEAPSTQRQFDLLNILNEQLIEFGIKSEVSEFGVLYAKIPSNLTYDVPAIGFIAHVDTAPDFNGENVCAQVIDSYDGKDIKLNDKYSLTPTDFPSLNDYIGKTLIHTDGTSLLGSDDKAGVTIIMEMAKFLMANPDIKHGDICIGFTPDEEIGRGTVNFDVERFGAEYAYTLDGGPEGEIAFENFNAYAMDVHIEGRNVHPGSAKDQMVNASSVAIKFDNMLDPNARPQYTDGYEGFMHLTDLKANIEFADMNYIIRDHSSQKIEEYINLVAANVAALKKEFPVATIEYEVKKQYLNMADVVSLRPEIVDIAKASIIKAGITPNVDPIRGGTDGSNLSFIGLPCPNLFTGGHNFHGRYEYVCADSMIKAVEVVVNIIDEVSKQK